MFSGPYGEEATSSQPYKEFYLFLKMPMFSRVSITGVYYQMNTDVVDKELKAGVIGIRIERNYKGDGKFKYVNQRLTKLVQC